MNRERFYHILLEEGMVVPVIDFTWNLLEWSEDIHHIVDEKTLRERIRSAKIMLESHNGTNA